MTLRAGFNGTVGQSSAQVIDGSLKFAGGTTGSSNQYLEHTFSSDGNRRTFTLSFWLKRSDVEAYPGIFFCGSSSVDPNNLHMYFNGDSLLLYSLKDNSNVRSYNTTQQFRDISGWYHIVVAVDSTISSPALDRFKVYVNGDRVTEFSSSNHNAVDENTQFTVNQSGKKLEIGLLRNSGGVLSYTYNGNMSQWYFIDGQALGPENFGFTDGLTNTWRPKKYTGTFGTNGFYLPMDGNSLIGQDKSGNGNDFTPINFGGSVALDNPQVSGARPILNTTQGGTQAGVGVFGSKEGFYETVSSSSGGGNPYIFDGRGTQPTLSFIRGATYVFDYSSATSHPLRFSTTSDGTHGGGSEYTTGTSVSGNVISFTVPHDAPDTLYYYCTNHSGMGNSISVTTDETKADQYASNCTLALPLVGSKDDVSNQINSGSTTKTITANGNAAASSAQSNFYGGSYTFDGTGDYLSLSSSTDFGFGTGDFTLEYYLYPTSLSSTYHQNLLLVLLVDYG